MKKLVLCMVFVFICLLSACSEAPEAEAQPSAAPQSSEATTGETTTNAATPYLPVVYSSYDEFFAAGSLPMPLPENATETTWTILYADLCQEQFYMDNAFYTYRASATRTGAALSGIDEAANYIPEEVAYTPEASAILFEAHKLPSGGILLWTHGDINYCLYTANADFDALCSVASLLTEKYE